MPLHSLAKSSGFVLRRLRKLSLEAFLQSLLFALHQPSHSFQSWAAQLSALQDQLFSKQALHRRCGQQLVKFLERLLASVLGSFTRRDCPIELFQHFGRVLLQDSTALALNSSLAKHFPAAETSTKANWPASRFRPSLSCALRNGFISNWAASRTTTRRLPL